MITNHWWYLFLIIFHLVIQIIFEFSNIMAVGKSSCHPRYNHFIILGFGILSRQFLLHNLHWIVFFTGHVYGFFFTTQNISYFSIVFFYLFSLGLFSYLFTYSPFKTEFKLYFFYEYCGYSSVSDVTELPNKLQLVTTFSNMSLL